MTKRKGDIAEYAATLEALRRGWDVLIPVGDRLPYDLVFSIRETFIRVQVKHAWLSKRTKNYVVDSRRTKTNRRIMKRERYAKKDFDFALVYIAEKNLFYVFPVDVFIRYGSEIHMTESQKRQRKPASEQFRNKWDSLLQWATQKEIFA